MRKIMIVDDSAVFRLHISKIIKESGENMQVVATAPNGKICLQKMAIPKYAPDVVILDIMMPEMDGVETVRHIMDRFPTPVILVSSMKQKDVSKLLSNRGMSIFESGTVEFVAKPATDDKALNKLFERKIIATIRNLAPVNLQKVFQGFDMKAFMQEGTQVTPAVIRRPITVEHRNKIIIVASSTGGTRAVSLILSKFPSKSPPLVIVQHMPELMSDQWAERLDSLYKNLDIAVAKDGEKLKPNSVYIARGGKHLVIDRNKTIKLEEAKICKLR